MKKLRPPIVTVLGHVDHGKTSLLDAIRKTSVAAREAGGITQGIGATQIKTSAGKITFVDTPGHAAFSKMRLRGARVADIAVLVVAGDDGIMPQTREALSYIVENKLPFIVALTKVDLPSSNSEKVLGQLEQEQVFFEGRGGQTPFVEVSSKTGKGVDELVEMIELVAAVNEISGDPEAPLDGVVIETNRDKRGTLVSVVVKNGTLRPNMEVSAGSYSARVKGLFDENNIPCKESLPGGPALILGFTQTPEVGALLTLKNSLKNEPDTIDKSNHKKIKVGEEQLGVIIKAQTAGALEAITALLPADAVEIAASVGDVTETDVFYAKTSKAIILAFESKVSSAVAKLAEAEHVEVAEFRIIYELSDFVEKKLDALKTKILGRALVVAEFPFDKTKVAGCKIIEGRIVKNDNISVTRNEKEIQTSKVISLKRGKNDIPEARAGEECGIILSGVANFEKGDILVATK